MISAMTGSDDKMFSCDQTAATILAIPHATLSQIQRTESNQGKQLSSDSLALSSQSHVQKLHEIQRTENNQDKQVSSTHLLFHLRTTFKHFMFIDYA